MFFKFINIIERILLDIFIVLSFSFIICVDIIIIFKSKKVGISLNIIMIERPTSLSKSFVYFLFAIVLIGLQLAFTLNILQGTMGYTGYEDPTKVVVTTCNSEPYKTTKFLAIAHMIKLNFFMSLITTGCFLIIFIICLIWVIRICKLQQSHSVSSLIQRKTKIVLYLIGSISVMTLIPVFGYYLTFIVQIPSCDSYSYDETQIRAIMIIAAIFLFVSLVIWIIFLYIIIRDTSQQKYKQIGKYQTYNTEPAEKVQQYKQKPKEVKYQNYQKKLVQMYTNQRASPSPPPPPPKIYTYQPDKENTQQNLFQSSSKKAIAVNYNKQRNNQSIPQQNKFKSPIQKYVYQKNPQPKPYSNISSNYVPPQSSNKLSPQKPGDLIYHKNRSQLQREDHDSFKNEEQRYLSKYGGPILPSSGVSEVEQKEKKEYFNSPNKRNNTNNSPNHGGREGVLAKYIRGKYAN